MPHKQSLPDRRLPQTRIAGVDQVLLTGSGQQPQTAVRKLSGHDPELIDHICVSVAVSRRRNVSGTHSGSRTAFRASEDDNLPCPKCLDGHTSRIDKNGISGPGVLRHPESQCRTNLNHSTIFISSAADRQLSPAKFTAGACNIGATILRRGRTTQSDGLQKMPIRRRHRQPVGTTTVAAELRDSATDLCSHVRVGRLFGPAEVHAAIRPVTQQSRPRKTPAPVVSSADERVSGNTHDR